MSLIELPSEPRRLQVVTDLDELRAKLDGWRASGQRIALVPTMGNLHQGHLSLVEKARTLGDITVTTIFVNPFQFGENEDFDTYPRTFDADVSALDAARCDVLFAPSASTVYPRGPDDATRVEVPALAGMLCGESRPTFFRGVATVVNILFNMVQPHVALFGEKDYQQLLVVRRMVSDMKIPVDVQSVPTVREPDGLALSSRNSYLCEADRRLAPELYSTLIAARDAIRAGDRDFPALVRHATERLAERGFRPDYVSIRRQCDLAEAQQDDVALIVLAAAWLGDTRLIDNVKV